MVKDPGHLIDVMATCLDLAGAKPPSAVEGISLAPAFEGKALERKQPIFWEHEGNRAVRDGKWKLVAKHNRPWELYDVDADRVERNDLTATESAMVKDLAAQWDAWARRVGVRPWNEIGAKKKGKK
jgi:arylsulfatase